MRRVPCGSHEGSNASTLLTRLPPLAVCGRLWGLQWKWLSRASTADGSCNRFQARTSSRAGILLEDAGLRGFRDMVSLARARPWVRREPSRSWVQNFVSKGDTRMGPSHRQVSTDSQECSCAILCAGRSDQGFGGMVTDTWAPNRLHIRRQSCDCDVSDQRPSRRVSVALPRARAAWKKVHAHLNHTVFVYADFANVP